MILAGGPSHEGRIFSWVVLSAAPAAFVALWFLWTGHASAKIAWTLTIVILAFWIGGSLFVKERVTRPLQTISNLLAALREGDLATRGRGARVGDTLGEALLEINLLGETLARQRSGELEATALLRKVMSEIDVVVMAFDGRRTLRLVNRAGERLLGAGHLLGRSAEELGLAELLQGEAPRTIEARFGDTWGQWEVRRGVFRQGGLPHQLVVLADLKRALRQEERQAWQRLVRVLGHEINNSLAPIQSIANGLRETQRRADRPPQWEGDVARGLSLIERRAESLGRFMSSYANLAKLPQPKLGPVDVGAWIRRVVEIEKRAPVTVTPGPSMVVLGDGDQLDQLLINLVRNGVDAAQETGGSVEVSWHRLDREVEIVVTDGGPGLRSVDNLFVPFFTTKEAGSGIGLVLSRQIAEAHHGALTLENRRHEAGCEARLRLPI